MASSIIESPVADSVDHLIADEERVFLARQPRSTEMIARAREHLAGGAHPTGRSPSRSRRCG